MTNKFYLSILSIIFFLCFLSNCTTREKANTYIYTNDQGSFVFPEDHLQLKSTGVCFSGGGTRAMNCASGQMKALDSLGIWPHIGYISSVSGGTWASSIFTYYRPTKDGPKNDKELLGSPKGVKNLSFEYLTKPLSNKHILHVLHSDLTLNLLEETIKDDISLGLLEKPHDIWIDAIGKTYLKAFGLYEKHKGLFTLDEKSRDDIIQRNPDLKLTKDDFYLVHQQKGDAPRPYLVMNSAVLSPANLLPLDTPEQMSVFNYSPLGVGAAKFLKVDLNKYTNQQTFPVGGGFIEPFAMGGTAPIKKPTPCGDNRDCATVKIEPRFPFRLADAVGTSSAAFSAKVAENFKYEIIVDLLAGGSIDPEESYWSPKVENLQAQKFRFADGGSLENFGVISLLQRKVQKMVVFINTDSKIDTTFNPASSKPKPKTIDDDFYTLFADFKYGNHINNNVFSKEDFVNVFNQFKHCIRVDSTVMAKIKTKTLKNEWWGIPKGQEVEILWMYNYKVPSWEKHLPQPVQDTLNNKYDKTFPNFPRYKTEFPDEIPYLVRLSPAMVKLLYELQFYNVYSNGKAFDFLKE